MGKGEEQPPVQEVHPEAPPATCSRLGALVSRIFGVFSFRCVLVLILSFCVCLSAVLWLPPFRSFGSGSDRHGHGHLSAPIQASFNLQIPSSFLAEQKEMLEYEIFEEIGLPYTKVSIVSMIPLAKPNWTNVVFGILPDPSNVIIPDVTLSVLRSSFIELLLRNYNITLTPAVFGKATSFEILKFPEGITVSGQFAFLRQMNQMLFNFTLNNSISQIEENLNQLKDQLKYGLKLRPYENVYVQMTNLEGSSVAPPVIVQATILSDIGSKYLLPERLKQLAEALSGSHDRNLGLDHAVFGKVKQIQLSSYLEHSLGSSPSPSPSPSPDPVLSPTATPSPREHSHFVPSSSPNPSVSPDMPLPPSGAYVPSSSPIPHVSPPENGPSYPFPPPSGSPAPSVVTDAHFPMSSPAPAPIISPTADPTLGAPLYSPISPPTGCQKGYPSSPHGQPRNSRRLGPNLSPSAAVPDAPSPKQNHQNGEAKNPLALASSPMSPSPTPSLAASTSRQTLLILPGLVIFSIFCGFYY